jgi:hypothetical protein
MKRCERCGCHALNDDPGKRLCDCCWRDAEIERLRTIVDRLPKCWRLNESGELVQDVPMVPGLRVWIKFGGKITEAIHDGTNGLKSYWGNADLCYSSLEAAEAARTEVGE